MNNAVEILKFAMSIEEHRKVFYDECRKAMQEYCFEQDFFPF